MKKHFISIVAVVAALAVTVCILGVGSVSAMKSGKVSPTVLGFTGEYTYAPTHEPTEPYSSDVNIDVDYTSYFIVPANNNMSELIEGRITEIYNGNADHSITFEDVPASDKVYEFYVQERFFGSYWGNYSDGSGTNLAFIVASPCDVTITETSYHIFAVSGTGVTAVACDTPVGYYAGEATAPATTAPWFEPTYPEGTTEPVIAVDYTSYFIIPANRNMHDLVGGKAPEIYNGDPDGKVVLHNVPASDKIYEFYVDESMFNQTCGTYGTERGTNFAFKVTETCDVTIREGARHQFVIIGDGVALVNSETPTGEWQSSTEADFTTVPVVTYPYVTYPEIETTAAFIATTGAAARFAKGDVNRDGRVDVVDATLIQRYSAGLEGLDDEQLGLARVCGLTSVTVVNATQIQKYAAGFGMEL